MCSRSAHQFNDPDEFWTSGDQIADGQYICPIELAERAGGPMIRPADAAALDETDLDIVAALTADGRLSVNELARRVNISRATAYSRLERLRSSGVITGFTTVVDQVKLGLPLAVFILLNVEQHGWRTLSEELRRLPGFQYLALTSGEFDMILLVRVADVAALRDVVLVKLSSMPEVRTTRTIFVLDEQHPDRTA
jgi:DNA-binding Lrp family transcriptional regulator